MASTVPRCSLINWALKLVSNLPKKYRWSSGYQIVLSGMQEVLWILIPTSSCLITGGHEEENFIINLLNIKGLNSSLITWKNWFHSENKLLFQAESHKVSAELRWSNGGHKSRGPGTARVEEEKPENTEKNPQSTKLGITYNGLINTIHRE